MGDFDNYTLDELREIVDPDRPEELGSQADSWSACAQLLSTQLGTLRSRLSNARGAWSGVAAEVFFSEMDRRCDELDAAAGTASDNARVWGRMRDHAQNARTGIFEIYEEWKSSGGTSDARDDPRRKPFDERARTVMGQVAEATDQDYRRLRYQRTFTPIGQSGSDSGGGAGGSDTGSGSGAATSGGASAVPAGADLGPSLQSTAPVAPAPPAPPSAPAPPSLTAPPPPPIAPPPVLGPRPGIGPRPATPPSMPRPPQRTVASVIGSRPGTTGMAPTSRGPAANQVTRPVIGTRPAAAAKATPTPSRRLVGGNGVVKGPGSDRRQAPRGVRVPKANFGDRSVNRGVIRNNAAANPAKASENVRPQIRRPHRRDDRQGVDGDYTEEFWQPSGPVVPGVVTGHALDEGPHDPGPVMFGRTETRKPPETERPPAPRLATPTFDPPWKDLI